MCAVEGCEVSKVKARGMCKRHYEQWLSDVPKEERSAAYRDRLLLESMHDADVLAALASVRGSVTAFAESVGVSRTSARAYARRNPWFAAASKSLWADAHTPEKLEAVQKAAAKRWRESNPDKVRAINRKWAKNQAPENRAKWNHYNRTRRLDAGAARLSPEAVEYLSILSNDPCSYCGGPAGEGDHIVPLALGGTNEWDNYTSACRSDNASKNDTPLLQYLLRRNVRQGVTS